MMVTFRKYKKTEVLVISRCKLIIMVVKKMNRQAIIPN